MFEFKVTDYQDDFKKLQRELRHAEKELPFAQAFTLTRMGQAGKKAAEKSIPRVFDRPTKWTRESVFLESAKKTRLQSEVYIKDGSIKSLEHHITGGKRRPKRYERRLRSRGILPANMVTVPGIGMKLDQYGNVTMAQINKILSAMGAQGDGYANSTSRSIRRNAGQARIFAMKKAGRIPSGIYRAKGKGDNRQFDPMLIFVKSARYRRRWHFHEIVEDAGYDAMDKAMDEVLDGIFSKRWKRTKR